MQSVLLFKSRSRFIYLRLELDGNLGIQDIQNEKKMIKSNVMKNAGGL